MSLHQEVLERAEEYNVKFVRLQFTDIFGRLKNIAIPVEELPRALEGKITFDSSAVDGGVGSREADIHLLPDPATFVIFPWRPREGAVARLICDVFTPKGEPYGCCSRSILKKELARLREKGLELQVGAEIEFYLLQTDSQGKPLPVAHDRAGYCDLTPVDLGENARRDMVLTLQEMGFEVSSSHHEIYPGQHEIFLKEGPALTIADSIVTFKFVVRTIAQRHGLHASFMPRPFNEYGGSGMHLHLSLWQGEKNAFSDPEKEYGLSALAGSFLAGLIRHAGALTAVGNPLVNSYKRLLSSDNGAPVVAAWSEEERRTMLRVPAPRLAETRIVWRSPDPTANPYLALAAVLAAGMDGVEKEEKLPPPFPAEGEKRFLPRHLEEALRALAEDAVVRQTLGEEICRRYLSVKKEEWERYQSRVHPWELEEYLLHY
ncbi:MAG: glutamine synthetase [Eubacteriales bacterium]|nr:glutamine synthetase [Eubacteriales bacterium]